MRKLVCNIENIVENKLSFSSKAVFSRTHKKRELTASDIEQRLLSIIQDTLPAHCNLILVFDELDKISGNEPEVKDVGSYNRVESRMKKIEQRVLA